MELKNLDAREDDPRHFLYHRLLSLLDKDIDELFEIDKHNFLKTVQQMVKETKEELAA